MNKSGIYIENQVLHILYDSETTYKIRYAELPLVRDKDYSEWVMQILPKTWSNTTMLYELAQIIEQEFPENKIDWNKTFFTVEKAKFLDEYGDALMPESNSDEGDVSETKGFFEKIKFNKDQSNEEIHNMIDKIVSERLADYGINSR
jgi:hypothetical protein